MKNFFIVTFIFIFCIFSFATSSKGEGLAYDFSLNDLGGQRINLSDFRNKQEVILFFWASWCAFCRRELRNLIDKYPALKKDNIEVLAVNIEESAKVVQRFLAREKIEFKVLLDSEGTVAVIYGIVGIPTYIWIDKEGKIKYKGHALPEEE
ncbi:MAG: TlpA family protein disulfide reductase [Candidatus Omnitrophica bacterium]|nr:TlpA family protein disulfide reductase [Candidatus Omnitrophota bacterium]